MKKIFYFVFVLVVFTIVACGNGKQEVSNNDTIVNVDSVNVDTTIVK